MTLNTLMRRIFLKNKFKFLGIIFMFIITILLFFSFDGEANAMKKIEKDITNKYKQQDGRLDLFNTNSQTFKSMIKNVESSNNKIPGVKSTITNKMSTDELLEKFNSKYGNDLLVEKHVSKDANKKQTLNAKDPSQTAKSENPIIVSTINKMVSIPFIKSGSKELNNGNVWIDSFIANKRKLKIGDTIKLDNKEYKISTIYGSPSKIQKQSFNNDGWALLTNDDFKSLKGEEKIELLVKKKSNKSLKYFNKLFEDISKDKDFILTIKSPDLDFSKLKNPIDLQKAVKNIKYKYRDVKLIQAVTELENDGEANYIHIQPDIHLVTAKFIAIIFTAILAILLTIILSKIITNYAVEIGVLKSFGYYKSEILAKFALIPFMINIFSIVVGGTIGYFYAAKKLLQLINSQTNLPSNIKPSITFNSVIMGIIIPFFVILISVLYNANKLINRKTVYLLRNVSGSKVSKISNFLNRFSKKLPMKRLMRLRLLFNGLSKTVAVYIGLAFSSMLVFFSIFFITSITHLSDNVFEMLSVKQIKYDPINYTKKDESKKSMGQLNVVEIIDVDRQTTIKEKPTKSITENKTKVDLLLAFNPKDTELKFSKEDLEKVKDGVLMSNSYKVDYGLNIGDNLIVKLNSDKTNEKKKNNTYELKIKGFYESAAPIFCFGDLDYVSKQLKLENKTNAVFTDTKNKLNQIKTNKTTSTLDLENIKENANSGLSQLWIIVIIFGTVAFLILLPIILILSGIIIDDNRKNIGILKALGYTNSELGSMMLNIYNMVVFIGIITGIGLGYWLTTMLFGLFQQFGMTIFIHWTFLSIVSGILLIFVIYRLNIALASRRIKKVVPIKELSSFT